MERNVAVAKVVPNTRLDKLALAASALVEVLAGSAIFTKLGLSPDVTAAILSGLMAAAAYARTKLPEVSSVVDKVAVGLSACVAGLAAAGVFDRIGLDADGVAHILGLILAIAAAVRWRGARAAPAAAALVLVFGSVLSGCAHKPKVAAAVSVAQTGLRGVAVATDAASAAWAIAVDAQIAKCKAEGHETAEARAQCMGVLGRGSEVEAQIDQIRDIYDVIAELLDDVEDAAAKVDAFVEEAHAATR